MKALYFHCHKVRFRITKEWAIDSPVWVLERAGKYSLGSGLHTGRHCWAAPCTPAGLTGLIVVATTQSW